jgi:hypothetical protein
MDQPEKDQEGKEETKPNPVDNSEISIDSYIDDAKYLYIRNINANPYHRDYNKAELDTAAINTIFGYFKAIYALNTPQTDSIFRLYKMKIYHKVRLTGITFLPLASKPGMANLINSQIPTGINNIDTFLNDYGFNSSNFTIKPIGLNLVTLSSTRELNMFVIERQLKKMEVVGYTETPQVVAADGDRMSLDYRGETAILSFFRGEGACGSGCWFSKTWAFEITNGIAVYKGRSASRPPSL